MWLAAQATQGTVKESVVVLQENLAWKKGVPRCYKYSLTFERRFSFPDLCLVLKEVTQLGTTLWQGVACDAETQQCHQCLGEL